MQIEIVTTKKKLTWTLVDQIRSASKEEVIETSEDKHTVLGWVAAHGKRPRRVLLQLDNGEYRTLPIYKWENYGDRLVRRLPHRFTSEMKFGTAEECLAFCVAYRALKDIDVHPQIFI